jgi:mannose-6-phosphate isomerase-like protein (cupin superfamily)
MTVISLADKFRLIDEHWSPRTVATVNDYDVRIAKIQGEFEPHRHPETDELFLVVDGELTIRMADGDVTLGPGEIYVVPRGVQHQPVSKGETQILMVEPTATVNTGDAGGAMTKPRIEL